MFFEAGASLDEGDWMSPGGRTPHALRFTTATTYGGLPEDPVVLQAVLHHVRPPAPS